MKGNLCSGMLAIALLLSTIAMPASAKLFGSSSPPKDENGALIYGEAGEKYPIVGTGGIRVSGGHHGIFSSNWKSSTVQIDGSGLSAAKMAPFQESTDFTASVNCVYFVSNNAVCTLQTAAGEAGSEIVVCNASGDATITYRTTGGETLLGGNQSAPLVNSTPDKVDRFICDGKSWYKE